MAESELIFNFFFLLLCISIIYPPTEFVSLGLTLPDIFEKYLGSEEFDFVRYHQKRINLTLFVHSSLPITYFILYSLKYAEFNENDVYHQIIWNVALKISILGTVFIYTLLFYWMIDDWKRHPISKQLEKFANSRGYSAVAADIANEFRRQDVLRMEINTITSLIATENWIIKITPYIVYFTHQSDTTLHVNKSETYSIAQDTHDAIQIISILATSSRPNVPEFEFRINALDFKTLQDRINRSITIPPNIQFHRNIIERFIDVFKDQVAQNPVFRTNQLTDNCFACMMVEPNIKLQKHCLDVDASGTPIPEQDQCKDCYCRPMWCVDCLARWFASRQNEFERDLWLQNKCSCPLCRAPFCILDVCYIEKID